MNKTSWHSYLVHFVLVLIVAALLGPSLWAQNPTPWIPVEGQENNMIALGTVYRNGVAIAATRYWVGSYGPGGIATDCRSVGPVDASGQYYATIRGSVDTEVIGFKIWDSFTGLICDVPEFFQFVADDLKNPFDLHFSQLQNLASGYMPLTPCRAFDTRNNSGPDAAAPVLAAGQRREFTVVGKCNVPAYAIAISANLTVVDATAIGDLRVTAATVVVTDTSSLSIPLTRARANNAVIQLSTAGDGKIAVTNATTGTVHFILDVNGYFQ